MGLAVLALPVWTPGRIPRGFQVPPDWGPIRNMAAPPPLPPPPVWYAPPVQYLPPPPPVAYYAPPRGHSGRRTSNFEHSSASRWSTTSSRPRTTTMTGNMNQQDELTMRYPSRSPELARLALAKAWRDFRRKRIDGAMFSEI